MQVMRKREALDSKEQKNLEILYSLMVLGGKSDRAIAKILGINNATLSKRKRKLEQEGYIKEYTIIPDFHKIGKEILLFSFSTTTDLISPQQVKEAKELLQKHPEVLCVLDGQDVKGTYWITISVHENYENYLNLCNNVKNECLSLPHKLPHVETHSFLIATGKQYLKPFSMRNLGSTLLDPKKPFFRNNRIGTVITPIDD